MTRVYSAWVVAAEAFDEAAGFGGAAREQVKTAALAGRGEDCHRRQRAAGTLGEVAAHIVQIDAGRAHRWQHSALKALTNIHTQPTSEGRQLDNAHLTGLTRQAHVHCEKNLFSIFCASILAEM